MTTEIYKQRTLHQDTKNCISILVSVFNQETLNKTVYNFWPKSKIASWSNYYTETAG